MPGDSKIVLDTRACGAGDDLVGEAPGRRGLLGNGARHAGDLSLQASALLEEVALERLAAGVAHRALR
jgi:hypothetical protein